MSAYLRVAAASIGPANGDLSASLDEASHAIARLATRGARLLVLPELFALPYTAGEDPALWPIRAEPLDGPTSRWARAEAIRHRIDIVFGMALATGAAKPLNAAVLARADGTLEHVASKRNLPPPGRNESFGEIDHFAPGDSTIECFVIDTIRIAVLICYDRRIPDRWHAAMRAGADLVLVLVAGPAPQDPDGFYLSELRGRAWTHSVYVLAAARCGTETVLGRPTRHDGQTIAIDPSGMIRSRDEDVREGIAVLDLDLTEISALRSIRPRRASPAGTAALII